ncbi:DUF1254 domain-containing protein [Pseudomonadota bacterium]
MNTNKLVTFSLALLMSVSTFLTPALAADKLQGTPTGTETDWREDYAYNLGVQAYIFSYPWNFMQHLRHTWVTQPTDPVHVPYMALNHFWHSRDVMTSNYQNGGSPNNDTLYSISWTTVEKEPLILSHPDMGDRYFTFEITTMSSDNLGYIGSRTTGSKAGHFALVGPNWKGTLPKGVRSIAPSMGTQARAASEKFLSSPNNTVYVQGRTAVLGKEDAKAVNKLQDQYTLTPLSQWGKGALNVPENRDVPKPFDEKIDPLGYWKTVNAAMTENPPIPAHAVLVGMFKSIGIGPGQDVEQMDEATQRGLARAAKDGLALMKKIGKAGGSGRKVNGWSITPPTTGSAGDLYDFVTRGVIQSMLGIIANDPKEAIYPLGHNDIDGNPLNGANNYTMTFKKGQLPDVKYFWSLTLYDFNNNLVKNPINRWAFSSNSGGYKFADDGSLTFYIQKESPGKDKESNWLPSADGGYWMIFRTYGPGESVINGTWEIPGLVKVKVK